MEGLRALDLEALDEVTRGLPLRWRSIGAAEGAALGALAFIPVAGSIASITLDVLVMHVLSTSIATRAVHAYGHDPSSSTTERMIDRMIRRSYREQTAKVAGQRRAGAAFQAAAGRKNWSARLRQDHRLLAAMERLMRQAGSGGHVPVQRVARAMPAVGVLVGAGTNSFVLGDVANQAVRYSQTVLLSDKYGLPLPRGLGHEVDDVHAQSAARHDGDDATSAPGG